MRDVFKGVFTALLSSFDADGRPDAGTIRKIARHTVDVCGVDGLLVCGSVGESANIACADKKVIIETVAEEIGDSRVLMANVGGTVVEEIVELAECAREAGYAGVSATPPYYFRYGHAEVADFFRLIADRIRLPLFLYNIPQYAGFNLSREDYRELFAHPNIVGLKYSHGDLQLFERIRRENPDAILHAGFDGIMLPALVAGADGVTGGGYNIFGHWAKAMTRSFEAGDLDAAKTIQADMNHVIDILDAAGPRQTMKEVLALHGIACGECRPPIARTNDRHRAAARAVFEYMRRVDGAGGA